MIQEPGSGRRPPSPPSLLVPFPFILKLFKPVKTIFTLTKSAVNCYQLLPQEQDPHYRFSHTCGINDRNILYKYREAKLTEEYGQRTRCNDTLKTENAIQKKILHQKDIRN